MYSEIILNRLNNLTYLKPLKGSNITATSKKNKFNDIVKFYAIIDENEVIQNITFKATGCTYFLVFCDYFCSLAEGKTIKEALKIDGKKLYTLIELNDSKNHVIDIILATFQLLIKKYRKGLEKGNISTKSKSNTGKQKTKETTAKSKEDSQTKKEKKTENATNKNDAKAENVKHLSSMLNKINSSKKSKKEDKSETIEKVNKASKNEIKEIAKVETKTLDNNSDKIEEIEVPSNESIQEKPQKKGLFSWLRKNK